MRDINRGLIVIKPKQPYVHWANHVDEHEPKLPLSKAHEDCEAYLVPVFEDDDEAQRVLKRVYKGIFENELFGWCTDEQTWPKRRGFKTFLEWFDVEFHSVVIDLGKGGIMREEH